MTGITDASVGSWRRPENVAVALGYGLMLAVLAGVTTRGIADFRVFGITLLLAVPLVYAYAAVLFPWFISAFLVAIAIVPIYWVPPPGGVPFTLVPAAFAALILAPISVWKIGLVRIVAADWIVLGLLVTGTITNYLNFDYATNFTIGLSIRLGLFYLAFRIIAQRYDLLKLMTVTVFATGALLALAALNERLSETNIFLELREPEYQAELWGVLFYRFGEIRAAASFGQPIPLGLFLATCVILGSALHAIAKSVSTRVVIVVCQVLLVGGLWATLTRAPLAVAAIGYFLHVFRTRRATFSKQLVALGIPAAFVYAFTPLGDQVSNLWANTFGVSTDKLTASSTAYRGALFDAFGEPGNYSVFGLARGSLYDQTSLVGVRGSVDNEFLLRLFQYGTVGLMLFAALCLVVLWAAFRETDPLRAAWAISTAAVAVALSTVALLLQQGDFFWIGIAVTAAGTALGSRNGEGSEGRGVVGLLNERGVAEPAPVLRDRPHQRTGDVRMRKLHR
ncbi:hypothetical protein [Rhodococcoides kroppenstedtii]|uniref:hypothetical protein n=1 Tax=Rhodococcoides kroppenstedtii TaxID=293050 RepID=UPI00363F1D69